MLRIKWSLAFAATGLLLVAALYGLIWFAIPGRGIANDWYIYGPFLLAPYGFAAFGSGLMARSGPERVTSVLGIAVCLAGALLLAAAAVDAWPVFQGGRAPDMPFSAMIGAILLVPQYLAGAASGLLGVAAWSLEKSNSSSI